MVHQFLTKSDNHIGTPDRVARPAILLRYKHCAQQGSARHLLDRDDHTLYNLVSRVRVLRQPFAQTGIEEFHFSHDRRHQQIIAAGEIAVDRRSRNTGTVSYLFHAGSRNTIVEIAVPCCIEDGVDRVAPDFSHWTTKPLSKQRKDETFSDK